MKKQFQKSIYVILINALLAVSALGGCGKLEVDASFHETVEEPSAGTYDIAENSSEKATEEFSEELTEEATDTAETAESDEDARISLVMVGDILLHTPVAASGVQEDGSYNFDAVFSNVKEEIAAADIALVNQEVIIGGTELGISGYPSFNAPYELGDALSEAGFDVVLHATNHTLDKGKRGVNNCLNYWNENHPEMAVVGINGSQQAQDEIYVYEQDEIRIAILNYTYGTNGISMPSDMPYAVNLLREDKVLSDIEKAKAQADFIVVCPHWGTEYRLTQSAEQERWVKIFLENGVDLVIGTHPHVIEPIEWVRDDDGNEMLVYYSLGNFVNWTASSGSGIANRMVGGMAEVTIAKDADGEAYILDYGIEPLVCHLTKGANGVTTYLMSEYTEEMASQNAIIAQDAKFSREYCEKLCEEIWGGLLFTPALK